MLSLSLYIARLSVFLTWTTVGEDNLHVLQSAKLSKVPADLIDSDVTRKVLGEQLVVRIGILTLLISHRLQAQTGKRKSTQTDRKESNTIGSVVEAAAAAATTAAAAAAAATMAAAVSHVPEPPGTASLPTRGCLSRPVPHYELYRQRRHPAAANRHLAGQQSVRIPARPQRRGSLRRLLPPYAGI